MVIQSSVLMVFLLWFLFMLSGVAEQHTAANLDCASDFVITHVGVILQSLKNIERQAAVHGARVGSRSACVTKHI